MAILLICLEFRTAWVQQGMSENGHCEQDKDGWHCPRTNGERTMLFGDLVSCHTLSLKQTTVTLPRISTAPLEMASALKTGTFKLHLAIRASGSLAVQSPWASSLTFPIFSGSRDSKLMSSVVIIKRIRQYLSLSSLADSQRHGAIMTKMGCTRKVRHVESVKVSVEAEEMFFPRGFFLLKVCWEN